MVCISWDNIPWAEADNEEGQFESHGAFSGLFVEDEVRGEDVFVSKSSEIFLCDIAVGADDYRLDGTGERVGRRTQWTARGFLSRIFFVGNHGEPREGGDGGKRWIWRNFDMLTVKSWRYTVANL